VVLNLEWCDEGVVTRGWIKRYGTRWMICVKEMEVLCQRDGRAGLKLLDGQEEEDDDVLRGEE
jgi:hypothetical protein